MPHLPAVCHMPFRSLRSLATVGLVTATACAPEVAERDAVPATPGTSATAGAPPAPSGDPDSVAADSTAGGAAPRGARAAPAGATPAGDTLTPMPTVAGRSARDTVALARAIRAGMRHDGWPVRGPAVLPGAVLPAKRIVAFYGNPRSKRMGALGEYEVDDMLARLDREVAAWRVADPATPVQPALHLVTIVAQGSAGRDGKYRLLMDSTLIEQVYGWAERSDALLFLDIQVGLSTLRAELPRLLRFLERPNVHLGIDPEFAMHDGVPPGRRIGTMDAADVNYAIRTLSQLAQEKQLPPKVLVVHRFTQRMLTNADQIELDPRVQVVIHMDGWGAPWLKYDSYRAYVIAEPVQFAGFKLFFGNDTKAGDPLLTPQELVRLVPAPLYIQYQ